MESPLCYESLIHSIQSKKPIRGAQEIPPRLDCFLESCNHNMSNSIPSTILASCFPVLYYHNHLSIFPVQILVPGLTLNCTRLSKISHVNFGIGPMVILSFSTLRSTTVRVFM